MPHLQRDTLDETVGWTTVDELRDFVINHGWFSQDVDDAIQIVGTDPKEIANYLQILALQNALGDLKIRAAERQRVTQFNSLVEPHLTNSI